MLKNILKKAFDFIDVISTYLVMGYTLIIKIILLPWILFIMLIKHLYTFVFKKDI